jgi:IclR family acetate operon transcriptional repressor
MSSIRSVQKAIKLLQNLDANGDWLGVRELARRVGLTPPTTHNLLNTLREMSFVEYNATTKQYRLGLAAIRLGEGTDPVNQIRLFARPYIEALANEFDETVAVLIWQNEQAVAVDWIQAEHPLAVTHNHGVVENPIVLASGRVLLAYQPRAVQLRYAAREDLSRFGPNSPLTTEEMIDLLDKVAQDGFAITKNVTNSGIVAIGAPVFDANRNAILAIGCSEPLSRSDDSHLAEVQKRLVEVTGLMTKKLGGVLLGTAGQSVA